MNSLTLTDTHQRIEAMQTHGASKGLAEEIVKTIRDAKLEAEPATRGEVLELRDELRAAEVRLVRWIFVVFIGQFFASIGVVTAIVTFLR